MTKLTLAMHGKIASGKTTTAKFLNQKFLFESKKVKLFHSDLYWWRFGIEDREQDNSINTRHDGFMTGLVSAALDSNYSVILDSTTRRRGHRSFLKKISLAQKTELIFIHCVCSDITTKERISLRQANSPNSFGTFHQAAFVENTFEHIDTSENYSIINFDTDRNLAKIKTANSDRQIPYLKKIEAFLNAFEHPVN